MHGGAAAISAIGIVAGVHAVGQRRTILLVQARLGDRAAFAGQARVALGERHRAEEQNRVAGGGLGDGIAIRMRRIGGGRVSIRKGKGGVGLGGRPPVARRVEAGFHCVGGGAIDIAEALVIGSDAPRAAGDSDQNEHDRPAPRAGPNRGSEAFHLSHRPS